MANSNFLDYDCCFISQLIFRMDTWGTAGGGVLILVFVLIYLCYLYAIELSYKLPLLFAADLY
jgi:hypothetical protein